MECLCCKAKMRFDSAPFTVDRNGYHVSWDALPAWVCDQCGESLFETNEVNKIQKILAVIDQEQLASPDIQVAA